MVGSRWFAKAFGNGARLGAEVGGEGEGEGEEEEVDFNSPRIMQIQLPSTNSKIV